MRIGTVRGYARKLRIQAEMEVERRLRTPWPRPAPTGADAKVAVCFVSYNTCELTAQLLFSLFRVLGRGQIARLVAVDNASTDGSRALLRAFAREGLLEGVFNERQRYHGPAVNQAVNHLARTFDEGPAFDYVWILDSDAFVLREDAYREGRDFLKSHGSAAVGEFQWDLPDGYAHISSLLFDPAKVWRGGIRPFENSGTPAKDLHVSVRRHGHTIDHFPFRSDDYVLHLGRGTVKKVVESGEARNRHYVDAVRHNRTSYHFHGNPRGAMLYERFTARFSDAIVSSRPSDVLRGCLGRQLVEVLPPDEAGGGGVGY